MHLLGGESLRRYNEFCFKSAIVVTYPLSAASEAIESNCPEASEYGVTPGGVVVGLRVYGCGNGAGCEGQPRGFL